MLFQWGDNSVRLENLSVHRLRSHVRGYRQVLAMYSAHSSSDAGSAVTFLVTISAIGLVCQKDCACLPIATCIVISMSATKYCGSINGESNASREARCTLPLENGNRHHQAVSREPENEAVMVSPMVTFLLNIKSCCTRRICSTAEAFRPPWEPEAACSAYAASFALTSFETASFSCPKRSSAFPKVAYVG